MVPTFGTNLDTTEKVVAASDQVPLTVKADVTDGGTVTYQWYVGSPNSGGGTPIPDATNANYTVDAPNSANVTVYYYCVATNTKDGATATAKSNAATIRTGNNVATIDSFSLTAPVTAAGTVTDGAVTDGAVNITVPNGTTVTSMTPNITLTDAKASVSPASGTAQNFTSPVTYTVTAENGRTTKTYTVTVTVVPADTHMVTYALTNLTATGQPASVTHSAVLNATLTADSGCTLPATITVTMGGSPLTNGYTYNKTTGAVSISSVTGDVVITAAGVLTPTTDAETPSITNDLNTNEVVYTVGGTATALDATATVSDGGTVSYDWYSNTTNATGGTKLNVTTATYMPSTASAGTTYYYCVVTNTNSSATGDKTATTTSSIAKITVNNKINAAAPTIDTNLSTDEVTYTVNGSATPLTVTASRSDSGTLSYQWYSNDTNDTTTPTPVGTDSNSYTPSITSAGTTYYYCVVTNTIADNSDGGTKTAATTSSIAKITVNAAVPTVTGVTVSPGTASVQKGKTQQFTAGVTGTNNPAQTATWTVTGGKTGTSINNTGLLTVASDETATSLTVTATSTVDATKSGTATVTVTTVPVTKYVLTVNGGTGSGSYEAGAQITITANTPAVGKVFDKWTATGGGNFANETAAATTYTMPAGAATVTATYKDAPVGTIPVTGVTLNRNTLSLYNNTTPNTATLTATVAPADATVQTVNWTSGNTAVATVDASGKVTAVSNGTAVITATTMDGGKTASCTVTVSTYSSGGGGGSGSSSGSSSNNSSNNSSDITVTPPAADKPNTPTKGEITLPGKVDGGNATINVTDKNITDAFDKALADAKKNGSESNGVTLVLHVNTDGKTVNTVTVNLPKTVQDTIISKKIVNTVVVVDQPDIVIGMDLATVTEINKQANADVNITATRGDSGKLTGNAKTAVGSRPVFDLKVSTTGGKAVQSFGAGSVSVSIPYTLAANEKAGNVQAVYLDGSGNVQWLQSSVYDSTNKVLRFSTNHFSAYGVGYRADAPTLTDIANHWAKDDIQFVVNRGLLAGTSATTFSPNTAMTRGMFVTALGRLANADVSGYKQSSFPDVKADSYYMGYIEWASKNGIVNGGSDGKFNPDASITREQMAVIMSNYAKAIGFTTPKVHTENTFADSAKISAYAKDAVKQMHMAGVLMGKNGNVFDPQGTATRAEVSAVLRRFVELAISSDTMQGWTMNDSGQWMYYQDGKPVTGKKDIDGASYTFDQYGVTADVPKNVRYTTYTVQKGDSFGLIAQKLGCSISELERLNNKTRFEVIYPGEVLRVPEK